MSKPAFHPDRESSVAAFAVVDTLVVDGQHVVNCGFPPNSCGMILGGFQAVDAGHLRPELTGMCAMIGTANSQGEVSAAIFPVAHLDQLASTLILLRDHLLAQERAGGAVQ